MIVSKKSESASKGTVEGVLELETVADPTKPNWVGYGCYLSGEEFAPSVSVGNKAETRY